jgi:hypothetical protein
VLVLVKVLEGVEEVGGAFGLEVLVVVEVLLGLLLLMVDGSGAIGEEESGAYGDPC